MNVVNGMPSFAKATAGKNVVNGLRSETVFGPFLIIKVR